MKMLSSRLDPVKPSASAWVSQAAKDAIARGEDVIDLGLGEPDFDTPDHIKHAAHAAAMAGKTKYPPTNGTLKMRKAVVGKLQRENDLEYGVDEIIVSNGAKQVLFNAMMATLEEGDEVLLCAPYFGQYKDIVLILGGTPVTIECPAKDGFRLLPENLSKAITPRTKWIMLNLPSNPAGAVYSNEDLRALGAVLRDHPDILILSDEIYEHILFDGRTFRSFAAINPELKDRTLTVNGVSKAYAMTGWRIGYGAGPKVLIAGMTKVQSQICSGACSIAQAAAAAALNGPQDDVRRFCAAFEARRDLVVQRIARIEGLTLDPPGGAFYGLIDCSGLIGAKTPDGQTIETDADVTAYLLRTAGIAAVPGSAYDLSPFFRISTAASEAVLDDAMNRIAAAVSQLERGTD
ncbi:pyridoxal phosphate-dependent aminotransferase [Sulfitobacter geojensis]|uniref:Aminotransferase n=1 Tax=Sulfitobacter geojensis TaxID=1342299 RepID=A0AAE2W0B4_9RHOB|nr:pyridoxal phosphate-dependent aminotransferase [Sulfitobacter geojensis]MBM1690730.1 pyridoxal phosphate-dependent aminotransferase [Sulfitobacter geojensis]MBM1694796.1 pyridoxal phosphate-dependent aminotransferase [Sulfitobacter geojensis]MBM1707050.1 pyridoxal phosphate-dependent aminotransferase [Sulfitobacter geojensis]MBM1711108.1 pyridoxal phosphate-dependent aminotransferase [Sulfitobacter geojensis]MBM1715174.1 pyridoxal phosphate-dependent aminotransferase [Sulfitobacter geojensi